MGLSEFPDLLPVILYFGGHISDRSICSEISLIRRCRLLLRLLMNHYFFILVKAWSW
jgi:hypothetical protein